MRPPPFGPESAKIHEDNKVMLQMAASNNRLYHLVESLKVIPELCTWLVNVHTVSDCARLVCTFMTDQESGLQFGGCAVYLRQVDEYPLAYTSPIRRSQTVRTNSQAIMLPALPTLLHLRMPKALRTRSQLFERILRENIDMYVTEDSGCVVPLAGRKGVVGFMELAIGPTLERVFAVDDPIKGAAESTIKSLARFIGERIEALSATGESAGRSTNDAPTTVSEPMNQVDYSTADGLPVVEYGADPVICSHCGESFTPYGCEKFIDSKMDSCPECHAELAHDIASPEAIESPGGRTDAASKGERRYNGAVLYSLKDRVDPDSGGNDAGNGG